MRRRLLLLTTVLLVTARVALAVPASPEKYFFRQADGTVLLLQNHGDEHYHWITDERGRILEHAGEGMLREVPLSTHVIRKSRAAAIHRAWSSYDNPPVTNFGDRKVLCLIANFSDSTFVIDNPRERFSNMLNQEGYAYNGAIGSVRDYYVDNSNNRYRPQFDVYGPVTLSHSSRYYDDSGVRNAILEAYGLLADEIPIDDYDTDGDGSVDMVLFYYPGHNEAEGAGSESIWPHQSSGYFGMMGGKVFNRYFCTSELRGSRGTEMCAIGTTCHEFAHSLGLPDFYDTDYANYGENSFTTGYFDLMSSGNYNDSGRRPPYLNAVERNMLGWMPLSRSVGSGAYALNPVHSDEAYVLSSAVEGEYFVLECRDNYKWDSSLYETGLLVYHIDKSERVVRGSTTAATLWKGNAINAYGGHPCFYLLPSSPGSSYVFPGSEGISSLMPEDWDGNSAGVLLKNIAFDGAQASFEAVRSTQRMMFGTVQNSFGNALEGARVVLSQSAYPFAAAPSLLSTDAVVTTNADGYYEITLPDTASPYQILTVYADGYQAVSVNVSAVEALIRQNFYLSGMDEGEKASLQRYDPSLTRYATTFGLDNVAVGMCYPADELQAMGAVGSVLQSIGFQASPSSYEKVYVLVDIGGQRALLRDVTEQFSPGTRVQVFVGDAHLTIPEGADVYIGYGITGAPTDSYWIDIYGPQAQWNEGAYAIAGFLDSSTWSPINFGEQYYCFGVSAGIAKTVDPDFSFYGVASIGLRDGVPVAVAPGNKTVYKTQWFLDDAPVDTPPATASLPAGSHTYKLHLMYYDGSSERVWLDVEN
ncbi:MAG: M6 family metalloprotease domain-containing protein [Bacteroidales bacterium]|nr:M6 family metalloprotease domain-containing protein [Bacteroidales bacterium]